MTTLDEVAASALGGLKPVLREGVEAISGNQTITFAAYTRVVLPVDGFVFWVRDTLAPPVPVSGSLHVATERVQREDAALGRVAVVFTSEQDLSQGFNVVDAATLLIGSAEGDTGSPPIRFAFSRLGVYENARQYHYSGVAITPQSATQIIDDPTTFDPADQVVSSSLPAWLGLNNYLPFYGFGNMIPLFPSFLVPSNMTGPYGAVHVEPSGTENLALAPYLTRVSSHYSLVRERVRITLFGVKHADAMNLVDCILQFSRDYNVIGIMNGPVVRDEHEPQAEMGVLAQKKVLDMEVSFDRTAFRNITRQLITNALSSVYATYPADWPEPPT